MSETKSSSQPRKIALVLAGGGAKGAYQLGVWKELMNSEFRGISTIAGTSVGALNAILFAGDYKDTDHIWQQMGEFGKADLGAIICLIQWLMFCLVFFAPLCISTLAFVAFVLTSGLMKESALLLLFLSAAVFSASATESPKRVLGHVVPIINYLEVTLGYMFALPVVYSAMMFIVDGKHLGFKPGLGQFFARTTVIIVASVCASKLSHWARGLLDSQYSRAMRSSLLDRRLLEDLIKVSLERMRNEAQNNSSRRVIVTLAKYSSFYDPTAIQYEFPGTEAPMRTAGEHVTQWVPHYKRIDNMSLDMQLELLLDTSAIPFAFPNRVEGETSISDGGLVDNTPVAPVLVEEPFDIVFVVLLRKQKEKWKAGIWKYADERWGMFLKSVKNYKSQDEQATRIYWQEFQRTKPSNRKPKTMLCFIEPSEPLAWIDFLFFHFLTGTLNFNSKRFRKWKLQGEKDTRAAIELLKKNLLERA